MIVAIELLKEASVCLMMPEVRCWLAKPYASMCC